MEPQSSIVILLWEFEDLKGIVIDDHRQASEAFPWPYCIVFIFIFVLVLVEAEHVLVQPQFVSTSTAE